MTVFQMQTHQWGASVGNPGNGPSREELRRAKATIQASVTAHRFPASRTVLCLDGHSGTGGRSCLMWPTSRLSHEA
jgi:hypothetical protein